MVMISVLGYVIACVSILFGLLLFVNGSGDAAFSLFVFGGFLMLTVQL